MKIKIFLLSGKIQVILNLSKMLSCFLDGKSDQQASDVPDECGYIKTYCVLKKSV